MKDFHLALSKELNEEDKCIQRKGVTEGICVSTCSICPINRGIHIPISRCDESIMAFGLDICPNLKKAEVSGRGSLSSNNLTIAIHLRR